MIDISKGKANSALQSGRKNWKHEMLLVNVLLDDPLQIIGENANFFPLIGLGAQIGLIWILKKGFTSTFFT